VVRTDVQRTASHKNWAAEVRQLRQVGECEKHAAECRQLAAEMKNPKLKKQLDDMAEVWDRLARQRRQGIVENNPDQI